MKNNSSNPTWAYCPNKKLQINSVSISDDGSHCVFGTSFERGNGKFNTFLYDSKGNQIWKKEISDKEVFQGVFWVDISSNGDYIASGGELSQTQGFLKAYSAETAQELLNVSTNSRINQVSLNEDGSFLAVCYGKTLEVYQLNLLKKKYEIIATETSTIYNINSCKISLDGSTVVASGIMYSNDNANSQTDSTDSSTTTGKVFSYKISNKQVTSLDHCELSTGCMRVAIVDSGQFWAASLHDGSCMLFNRNNPNSFEWHCTPDNPDLILAYAVDVTETESGEIFVACGANLSGTGDGGFLYLVKSSRMVYADYPEAKYKGIIQWSTPIKYGVNPGVTMDKNATYVSATDGKPDGQTVKESAGSFYLYSGSTGDLVWKYDTTMMNWPMMLARNGKSVFGGSDNGTVYYWKLSES